MTYSGNGDEAGVDRGTDDGVERVLEHVRVVLAASGQAAERRFDIGLFPSYAQALDLHQNKFEVAHFGVYKDVTLWTPDVFAREEAGHRV